MLSSNSCSMQPTLKNGSMIMVNRDVDNLSDGVYVMRHDNNLLVKRLQMLPCGIIRVKSEILCMTLGRSLNHS